MRIVDREGELKILEEAWNSSSASLIVVYGRRRIGKTFLLKHFLEDKKGVYLLAEELEEKELVRKFSIELAESFGIEYLRVNPASSWRSFLKILSETAGKGDRILVVLDEFQYATRSSPGLLSTIQYFWDEELSRKNIVLVLCSSIASFIEGEVLSGKAPLYGRAKNIIRLEELSPLYIPFFAPNWNSIDHVRLYSVFGGVPGYLASIDPAKSIWDNIRRLVLEKNSPYYDEPRILLKEEVRDVVRYYSILEAVAGGATRFAEIANHTGIPRESLYKYLRILIEMGLLSKETPVIGKGKPYYKIKDMFTRFWFTYNARYRSALELELVDRVLDYVKKTLDETLVPWAWEKIVEHIIAYMARRRILDLTPTRMGKWWYKNSEIDLVAIDDLGKKLLVGEVKWRNLSLKEALRIASRLEERADKIPYEPRETIILIAAKRIEEREVLVNHGVKTITLEDYYSLTKKIVGEENGFKQA